MMRGDDRSAFPQAAPQAMDMPRGEVGELGPAGSFGGDARSHVQDGDAFAALEAVLDQFDPGDGLLAPRLAGEAAPLSSEETAADLDTGALPDDQIQLGLHLAPVLLGLRHPGLPGPGNLEGQGEGAV